MSRVAKKSVVLITGATSGIGRQLAADYAAEGHFVWACGRNENKLSQLKNCSENIKTLCFDISDLQQAKTALDELFPVPDLWIFNAGDCEYIDNGTIDAGLIRRIFEINVIGLANCIEAAQRYFVRGQRIAVLGSIASEVALPRAEAYGASKAAVSYLSRSLALDLKPAGIEVSTIYPGFVATPLTDKNTFTMPMIISAEQASEAIRSGLKSGRPFIYFPKRFTGMLRVISLLPYQWQQKLVRKLTGNH